MRILVVEDDVNLNRQLVEMLTEVGYVVDKAFDGEEGHFLGDTEPYDAVILDIGPAGNGWDNRLGILAQRRAQYAGFDAYRPRSLE